VVFIDNDVVVAPGWLGHLLRCAGETGADIVAPLTCIGEPVHARAHMAGGDARLAEGRRVFQESHYFANRAVAEVRDKLVRRPCELAEFHCMLTRKSVFDRLGPLDEDLKAVSEHVDFCLTVRRAGGTVIFEPNAVVTYVVGPPLALSDIPYFYYRWSDEWAVDSERHFHEKWGTVFNDDVFLTFCSAAPAPHVAAPATVRANPRRLEDQRIPLRPSCDAGDLVAQAPPREAPGAGFRSRAQPIHRRGALMMACVSRNSRRPNREANW
jgi:hypothetical protein